MQSSLLLPKNPMECYAEEIMDDLKKHREDKFMIKTITKGDGNCGLTAVLQASDDEITTPQQLRKAVCDLALTSKDPKIVTVRNNYQEHFENSTDDKNKKPATWEEHWKTMSQDKVWVDDLFLTITGIYLNKDIKIWIVNDGGTFYKINGGEGNSGKEIIHLAYIKGKHYQSPVKKPKEKKLKGLVEEWLKISDDRNRPILRDAFSEAIEMYR